MAKARKLTPQEAMVAFFSRHSISGYLTFHPKLFGNGREPADMAIVVGRALVFVNMHEGRSYFDDLCTHNLKQAKDRIGEWKSGKPIRGENGGQTFHIEWCNIDYIHVVSIVDGPHAACSGHDLALLHMDSKVYLVTTLTSAVMRRLAELGGGARDLLAISRQIQTCGKITESQALQIVQERHDKLLSEAMSIVTRFPNRHPLVKINENPVSLVSEHRLYLEQTRRMNTDAATRFADLSWEDVFEIVSHVLRTISEIEWLDSGYVITALLGKVNKYAVVVSTNGEALIKHAKDLTDCASKAQASFIYTISLNSFGVIPMFASSEHSGPLAIELDFGAITQ